MRHRHPLTALRSFEAAARTGSFASAADELCVTRPAISKQIRLLEEDLGCTLFDRSRGVATLTALGDELYAGLVQSFDLISETMARVRTRAMGRESLRVLVEHDFASSWLASGIGSFLVSHPGVSVEIVAEQNGNMRLDEDYDFRIFYVDPTEPEPGNLVAHELCRWIDLPLCAPEYLPASDEDPETRLREAHLLHDRSAKPWQEWLDAAGLPVAMDAEQGTMFNETALCLSAAAAGAGIAIGDSFLAFEPLRQGTLVPPFAYGLRSEEAYMLYRRANVEQSHAEQAFEAWLVEAMTDYIETVERFLVGMDVRIVS